MPRTRARAAVAALSAAVALGVSACTGDQGVAPSTPAAEPEAPPEATPGTPVPTGTATVPPLLHDDTCARDALQRLTPAERARQLLLAGVAVNRPGRTPGAVREGLGGVILTGRTGAGTDWAKQLTDRLHRDAGGPDGVRMLVAVDQEGGDIRTLRGDGLPRLPSALDQGRSSAAALEASTKSWAERLAAAGVSVDLAPVADTVPPGTARSNPPIGAVGRHYGTDPAAVSQDVAAVTRGLQDAGVLATLKHFPGLGRVRVNTDYGTGAVDRTADADDPYLAPFRAGISGGAGAVMISNASYPRLDADHLAPFSEKIVTGLLREDLGWDGLVISDDLSAAKAVADVPVALRATRFVAAGGDLVIIIHAADAEPMAEALTRKAAAEPAFRARVDEAALNVLRVKQRFGALDCTAR